MMAEIEKIIAEYAEKGIEVTKETVEYLIWYCYRKMDVAKIENKEEYLPLLFKDEIKNSFFRKAVNMSTMLKIYKKEGMVCAKCAE